MATILGISAFYHDSAACLIVDGEIVAAAQEERFTRKKHDAGFPTHACQYVLSEAGVDPANLTCVAFYDKPLVKFDRLLETYLDYAPAGFPSFVKAMPLWIKEKLWIGDRVRAELADIESGGNPKLAKKLKRSYQWKVLFGDHHESHAASAFYPSPFDEAAILTVDGVGEWTTSSIGIGRGREITLLKEIRFPDSLGLLYSAFTYFTGFKVNSGEYKLMGLAPYGEPKYVDLIKEKIVTIFDDGSIRLNQDYFTYCQGLRMTGRAFERLFGGPARSPESKLTQREMDIARSIQEVTEEVMLKMGRHVYAETGQSRLCLAGGVALNCVANGRLLREGPFEEIWIQPAAGDAGGALGVALAVWHRYLGNDRRPARVSDEFKTPAFVEASRAERSTTESSATLVAAGAAYRVGRGSTALLPLQQGTSGDRMRGAFLGPQFSASCIEAQLRAAARPYRRIPRDELPLVIAEHLASGNIVGLLQGRMEFGPRALGGRSILGDPRSPRMQSIMNLKIKYRESFRPFAPSVLREHAHEWFDLDVDSPYMLLVADVAKRRQRRMRADEQRLWGIEKLNVARSEIPAVTHIDYSARIQTVRRDVAPLYWEIIEAFRQLTGCPVVVNTSFNVRGEPIVCTPEDAYRCFIRTEMDALVLEDCVLTKAGQPPWHETGNWRTEFALD